MNKEGEGRQGRRNERVSDSREWIGKQEGREMGRRGKDKSRDGRGSEV